MEEAATHDYDDPALIARGRRYLAWSAAVTAVFIVVATFALHVAQERHERAVATRNQAAYAAAGADVARYLPNP